MTVATLGELGKLVEGLVRGPAQQLISNALPLKEVASDGCITLVDKASSSDALLTSGAVAAVVPVGFPETSFPVIEVCHPHLAFERIIQHLRPALVDVRQGVHIHAQVHPSATIGPGVVIAAGVSVGAGCCVGAGTILHAGVHLMANCTLGEGCELYPGVVLYPDTRVGARCLFHAGTVLGAYGFGYRTAQGKHERCAQVGWVDVGDDVEMGACVTVDRGTYGPTRIGTGTKLDNHVMIGHNCQIGRHNLICAQVGIAGSSSTGDYVVLAGQVGIKDHTHLGDRVTIAAQSGIMHDIPSDQVWSGTPAMPTKRHMLSVAAVTRLPEMRNDLRRMEVEAQRMQQQLIELRALLSNNQDDLHSDQRAA